MRVLKLIFIITSIKLIDSSSFLGDLLHLVNHFNKHNNFITLTAPSNLFVCFPSESEKCTRVKTFQIASNNTFDCNHITIGIYLIDVLDYSKTFLNTFNSNCSGNRVTQFSYIFENSTLSKQLVTSNDCPRIKRFFFNAQETIIIFDKQVFLWENHKIDEFIHKRLLETLSFLTYFLIDYYHESTNSFYKMRLLQDIASLIIIGVIMYKIWMKFYILLMKLKDLEKQQIKCQDECKNETALKNATQTKKRR